VVHYYAFGGGLGHLTRARHVLAALGHGDRATLLTTSPFAADARVTGGLPVITAPRHLEGDPPALRRWLADTFAALEPSELIVDSFPGGIVGELCGLQLPPARHVARRLQWPVYSRRLSGPLPRYETTHILEPLAPDHAAALARSSRSITDLELAVHTGHEMALTDRPHWLVVHGGPDPEVVELLRYAADMRSMEHADPEIFAVTPRPPSWLPTEAQWRNVYPVTPYLGRAARVITAAGFNLMRELAPLRDRQRFMPFPRALDDQFHRAAAARTLTSLSAGCSDRT
jgi:hypothetical protein